MRKKYFLFVSMILILATVSARCGSSGSNFVQPASTVSVPVASTTSSSTYIASSSPVSVTPFLSPISQFQKRADTKPFGLFVTPNNSPVSPEKFTGYHAGTDFETFADEKDADVSIAAICSGTVKLARYASGYGGVLVEACQLNNQPVTVIYGHLRLASIGVHIGDSLQQGQSFAVLGTGYSTETSGERKHLHLGIHKGTVIVILGYVQDKNQLSNWIDPLPLLQPHQ